MLKLWCRCLVGLPNNFGRSVPKLKTLKIRYCWNLKTLPNSIGLLTELEVLDLSGCSKLTTLPNSIGLLTKLEVLDISSCTVSTTLPNSIGGLVGLKRLRLSGCKSLEEIPMELGRLINLKELKLSFYENKNISLLNAGKLKSLLKVVIRDCKELSCIDTLPQCLEHLDLQGCCTLIEIPSLKPMKSLVYLNLRHCQRLRHIHGLECLTTLEFIYVVNCASIEDDGVNVNKDNKALRECDMRKSKVGVAYNNGWLEVRLLSLSFVLVVFLILNP